MVMHAKYEVGFFLSFFPLRYFHSFLIFFRFFLFFSFFLFLFLPFFLSSFCFLLCLSPTHLFSCGLFLIHPPPHLQELEKKRHLDYQSAAFRGRRGSRKSSDTVSPTCSKWFCKLFMMCACVRENACILIDCVCVWWTPQKHVSSHCTAQGKKKERLTLISLISLTLPLPPTFVASGLLSIVFSSPQRNGTLVCHVKKITFEKKN